MSSLTPAPVRPALNAGVRLHSANGRSLSHENRLPVIDEDSDHAYHPPPRVPPRAINRPLERMFGYHRERGLKNGPPPPYSEYDDVTGPKGEKFADVRENRRFLRTERRGGWKRLVIIAFIIAAVIAGAVVGVIVGLHEKNKTSSSSNSISHFPFPAGAWTFTTFLSTVTTACTANPATWLCYPYQTYNSSTTGSMATFNWIITFTDQSDANYVISSSENPFALTFTNSSLQLIDAGLESEAYTFSVPMDKVVMPQMALTSDNSATSCIYNNTVFKAMLYTKLQKTYPEGSTGATTGGTSTGNDGTTFQPWPHAVKVDQIINGGGNVPACFKTMNGQLGAQVTEGLEPQSQSSQCTCEYLNYGNQ